MAVCYSKPMIFKLKRSKDEFLDKAYNKAMKELDAFYGIGWVRNRPNLFIVEDRGSIDALKGIKTERWVTGWANRRDVYLLDQNNFGKESSHNKHNNEEYAALLKHELSHLFFGILSDTAGRQSFPVWFCEGVASYTAGQLKFKKPISEFNGFLSFYEKPGTEAYSEAGFFIEILVNKFGKKKLLELIKSLKTIKTQKDFDKTFFKIYGFKLSYKEINKLHHGK